MDAIRMDHIAALLQKNEMVSKFENGNPDAVS